MIYMMIPPALPSWPMLGADGTTNPAKLAHAGCEWYPQWYHWPCQVGPRWVWMVRSVLPSWPILSENGTTGPVELAHALRTETPRLSWAKAFHPRSRLVHVSTYDLLPQFVQVLGLVHVCFLDQSHIQKSSHKLNCY